MNPELAEITVVGDDDTGLLAEITSLLFEHKINIEDLDQAVQDGLFRMTMHVDTAEMDCSRRELRSELEALCNELGVDEHVRFQGPRSPANDRHSIAALVTKERHCLEALLKETDGGGLNADVDVVIGNHPDLRPLAREYDVPFHNVGDENGAPNEDKLVTLLDKYDIDLIALARYIRILSPKVVFRYQNRIINVHPSLLPAFPGARAYMQAIEEGVRISGVTAHYVTPDLDQGPIITQRAFNVPDNVGEEELREIGQPLEAEALINAIRLHLNDELEVGRGRTYVRDDDVQLGLPEKIDQMNPDEPTDLKGAPKPRVADD